MMWWAWSRSASESSSKDLARSISAPLASTPTGASPSSAPSAASQRSSWMPSSSSTSTPCWAGVGGSQLAISASTSCSSVGNHSSKAAS
jgi:hypothetical protein